MARAYVRILLSLALAGAILYALFSGVWGVTLLIMLIGIFIETVGIRDALDSRDESSMTSLGRHWRSDSPSMDRRI